MAFTLNMTLNSNKKRSRSKDDGEDTTRSNVGEPYRQSKQAKLAAARSGAIDQDTTDERGDGSSLNVAPTTDQMLAFQTLKPPSKGQELRKKSPDVLPASKAGAIPSQESKNSTSVKASEDYETGASEDENRKAVSPVTVVTFDGPNAFMTANANVVRKWLTEKCVNRKPPKQPPTESIVYQRSVNVSPDSDTQRVIDAINSKGKSRQLGFHVRNSLKTIKKGMQGQFGYITKTSPLMNYFGDLNIFSKVEWQFMVSQADAETLIAQDIAEGGVGWTAPIQAVKKPASKKAVSQSKKTKRVRVASTSQAPSPVQATDGTDLADERVEDDLLDSNYQGDNEPDEDESDTDDDDSDQEELPEGWYREKDIFVYSDEQHGEAVEVFEQVPNETNSGLIGGLYKQITGLDQEHASDSSDIPITYITVVMKNIGYCDTQWLQDQETEKWKREQEERVARLPYPRGPYGREDGMYTKGPNGYEEGYEEVTEEEWEKEYDLWDRGYIDEMWVREPGCPY